LSTQRIDLSNWNLELLMTSPATKRPNPKDTPAEENGQASEDSRFVGKPFSERSLKIQGPKFARSPDENPRFMILRERRRSRRFLMRLPLIVRWMDENLVGKQTHKPRTSVQVGSVSICPKLRKPSPQLKFS
jgi:hypothetical protein